MTGIPEELEKIEGKEGKEGKGGAVALETPEDCAETAKRLIQYGIRQVKALKPWEVSHAVDKLMRALKEYTALLRNKELDGLKKKLGDLEGMVEKVGAENRELREKLMVAKAMTIGKG